MHILISNDDGYEASGIRALIDAVKKSGVASRVSVVAPFRNVSSASSAITLRSGLQIHTIGEDFLAVEGTPTDCVHLSLTGLIDKPDLVLAGINAGANMGEDTLYSGTVSLGLQGYMFGIDAICFSQIEYGWAHLTDAARIAVDVLKKFVATKHKSPTVLNVNIPNIAYDDITGWEVTRLGRREFPTPPEKRDGLIWQGNLGGPKDRAEGTDFWAVEKNAVSITPLKIDLTDVAALSHVKDVML